MCVSMCMSVYVPVCVRESVCLREAMTSKVRRGW